jgi:hypothetical protein
MADAKARLQEIVNAYLDRDSGVVVDTGIVASHIAQMKLFVFAKELNSSHPKITSVHNVKTSLIVFANTTSLIRDLIPFGSISSVMAKDFFTSVLLKTTIVCIISANTNIVPITTLMANWMKL